MPLPPFIAAAHDILTLAITAGPASPLQEEGRGRLLLRRLRSRALAIDHLGREIHVGPASRALVIVEKQRLAVRRRLGDANVARDDRVVDFVAEEAANFGCDFVESLVRPSCMVKTTPWISSVGLRLDRTKSMVSFN